MLAGNYDIKEIFVDGILKIAGPDLEELSIMLEKIDKLTGDETDVLLTLSVDDSEVPERIKKFVV